MKCPFCGFAESRVIDSRPTDEGGSIRRRRECMHCGKRFTTYENVERLPLIVIKKNGSRQSYDRNKLLSGVLRACEKRPVSLQQMEALVSDVEQMLQNNLEREVTTAQIGELVIDRIKRLDEVAYVRFASVYRQFADIKTFLTEVNKLLIERQV
ncbi:MAG: transcriptional regulator NrdR [Oscillospiraceae bacterium]|nr:transcriptional regulator NrdR [Oscillospiraceae bacterium]